MSLSGPNGCRQLAPGTQAHHCRQSRKSTGPAVGRKTIAPGCNPAGSAPGYSVGSMGCSATVTYPVAVTNSANWALVTRCRSIEKASTLTVWIGASSGEKLVEPMLNDPAGRSTSSVGMGSGYDDGEVLH